MSRIDNKNPPRPVAPSTSQPAKQASTPTPATAAAPQAWAATGSQTAKAAPTQLPTDPKQMDIVCPVLGALVKEGKVKMNPDGTMKLADLREGAAASIGTTKPVNAALTSFGFVANKPGDVAHNMIHQEMNVLDLRAGFVKHPGDSAILTGGRFDQAKFDAMASHADHGLMTADSFAAAIAANVQRDLKPGQVAADLVKGKTFSETEFAGLLGVFGKTDPKTGKFGVPVEEMRALYQDKKLPPNGERPTMVDLMALNASLLVKVDANLAAAAFGSSATASGISAGGARLTEGGSAATAAGQASTSAGKAAACPHMNGGIKLPVHPNNAVNAHTPAGMTEH